MKIQIRRMTLHDIDGIMRVENICFSTPWSHASFLAEAENEQAIYFVAMVDDLIVGYIGYWKVLDEAHITNVAVHPDFRRQHIGCALLESLLETAVRQSITVLFLEVRESNLSAQALYEKYGFYLIGRRKSYYEKPTEDAILMEKKINYDEETP